MTEAEERAYVAGQRALALQVLRLVAGDLPSAERDHATLVREREEALAVIRRELLAVADYDVGTLHLADAIEKHLIAHYRKEVANALEYLRRDRPDVELAMRTLELLLP